VGPREPSVAAVVIDTNVVAYHLLGVKEHRDVLSDLFMADLEFVAPDSLKAEVLNVLWLAIRIGAIETEEPLSRLDTVDQLIDRSTPTSTIWAGALSLAVTSNRSPYDTLFVAAAEREHVELLTYDQPLRAAFPATAVDPGEFLSRT